MRADKWIQTNPLQAPALLLLFKCSKRKQPPGTIIFSSAYPTIELSKELSSHGSSLCSFDRIIVISVAFINQSKMLAQATQPLRHSLAAGHNDDRVSLALSHMVAYAPRFADKLGPQFELEYSTILLFQSDSPNLQNSSCPFPCIFAPYFRLVHSNRGLKSVLVPMAATIRNASSPTLERLSTDHWRCPLLGACSLYCNIPRVLSVGQCLDLELSRSSLWNAIRE